MWKFPPFHFHEWKHWVWVGRDSSGSVAVFMSPDWRPEAFLSKAFRHSTLSLFSLAFVGFAFAFPLFLGNGLEEPFTRGIWSSRRMDCACGRWESGVTGDLGFWCPSEIASRAFPQHIVYFQFLRGSFIMNDVHAVLVPLPLRSPCPHQLSPSAFLKLRTYLTSARSLLPLVLHVTCKKGIPEPIFKLPELFSPLTAFPNSISFWCALVSCPFWKWKRVYSITKKGVTVG